MDVTAPLAPLPPVAPALAKRQELSMPVRRELSMPATPSKAPEEPEPHRTPLSSVQVNGEAPAHRKKGRSGWAFVVALGLLGTVVGMALRWTTPVQPAGVAAQPTQSAHAASAPSAAPSASAASSTQSAGDDTDGLAFDDLPAGITLPQGQGLLVLTTRANAPVTINGIARGRGPNLSVPLQGGVYDVRVGVPGHELQRMLEVRAARSTKVSMTKDR
jgi:hypothetical protein